MQFFSVVSQKVVFQSLNFCAARAAFCPISKRHRDEAALTLCRVSAAVSDSAICTVLLLSPSHSTRPHLCDTITILPRAIPSNVTVPNDSKCDGSSNASCLSITSIRFFRGAHPTRDTFGRVSVAFSIEAFNGPSPAIVNWISFSIFAASMIASKFFSFANRPAKSTDTISLLISLFHLAAY